MNIWTRAKHAGVEATARRRGSRLGILIAIMAIAPGIVAGTSYVSGSSAGTLTSATANSASANCGWWKDAAIDGFVSATSITSTYASGGANAPTSGTITVTVTALESSTYEYEDDEIVFGCIATPASPATTTVAVTVGSASVTGATDAVIQITNEEPDAAVNPTSVGAACSGTLYNPADTAGTASVPVADAYVWNAIGAADLSACGTLSISALAPAAGIGTETGLLWISFAFIATGATGLSATAAFTFAYTATVAG